MGFFDSISKKIRLFFIGFFVGMKKTEEQVLTQKGTDGSGVGIIKEQDEQRVSKALLKGEITQSVKELRYRTYEVDKESDKVRYITPLAAEHLCDDEIYDRNITYDDSDGRELILIQGNRCYTFDVLDMMESVSDNDIRFNRNGEIECKIGKDDIDAKRTYTLNITRNGITRFPLEEFATMAVLKRGEDNDHAYVDIYVSIYPNNDKANSRPFLKALKSVVETGRMNDIVDISGLSFVTHKAYGKRDMFSYSLCNMDFIGTNTFDGSYVIKYRARFDDAGTDRRALYHDEIMAQKYATKKKKEFTANLDDYAEQNIVRYRCSECGKEVFMDLRKIDEMVAMDPRYADEEKENGSVMEFYDYQIAENTFGRQLCKDCMTKKMQIIVDDFDKKNRKD